MTSTDRPAPATVRHATTADLRRLGTLGALLVEVHHAFDARRFLAPTDRTAAAYASFLESQLGDADVVILVAEHDTEVIGFAYGAFEGIDYMSLRGPAGVVHDLVVEPAHQGRGVGRLLLMALLTHLRARGAERAVLSTAERNEAAQRLFESAGFRRTMVEMTRELDPAVG